MCNMVFCLSRRRETKAPASPPPERDRWVQADGERKRAVTGAQRRLRPGRRRSRSGILKTAAEDKMTGECAACRVWVERVGWMGGSSGAGGGERVGQELNRPTLPTRHPSPIARRTPLARPPLRPCTLHPRSPVRRGRSGPIHWAGWRRQLHQCADAARPARPIEQHLAGAGAVGVVLQYAGLPAQNRAHFGRRRRWSPASSRATISS